MMLEVEHPQLTAILESWERRAQVRQHTLLPASSFDPTRKDFLPEWLPFWGHPTFEKQRDLEMQILSVAWLQYNQVTIEIENEIVIPLCLALQLDLGREEPYRTLVVQAMVDEAYHVLLTNHATELTRKLRHLETIRLPKGHFVSSMQKRLVGCNSDWERNIVLLATGVITEVFIGAYLGLIGYCKDERLQPINIITTRAHMIDEAVHGVVFGALAERIVPRLGAEQKRFFWEIFPTVILWFFEGRTAAWNTLLPQIGFENGTPMIQDCRKKPMAILKEEHWPVVVALAERIGCTDFQQRLFQAAEGKHGEDV